jgi:hypothetical protein
MTRPCTTHHHACDCREAKFAELERELAELTKDRDGWRECARQYSFDLGRLQDDYFVLLRRIESAPAGELRAALNKVGLRDVDITALAIHGKRVRLVVEDES